MFIGLLLSAVCVEQYKNHRTLSDKSLWVWMWTVCKERRIRSSMSLFTCYYAHVPVFLNTAETQVVSKLKRGAPSALGQAKMTQGATYKLG